MHYICNFEKQTKALQYEGYTKILIVVLLQVIFYFASLQFSRFSITGIMLILELKRICKIYLKIAAYLD